MSRYVADARSVSTTRVEVRLAEFVAALSIATDLGMGQPIEFALSSCVLAVRLGDALGLTEAQLRDVYYQALLRYIGCNAETTTLAAIVGDELALRGEYAAVDPGHPTEVIALLVRSIRQANAGASHLQLARLVAHGLLASPRIKDTFSGHCEVAQRLAQRLGFEGEALTALGQLYERWDGRGLPLGLKGEAIARSVRIVTLAQDAITFNRLGGIEAAIETARQRSGSAYDPEIATCFVSRAASLLTGLDDEATWDDVLALEPGPRTILGPAQFDEACRAVADFADLKSTFTLNHSPGVARLAEAAARRCGLPETDAIALRRAGLMHDVGRVGVPTGIWEKPGALSERDWERVRLHPYYTERVLARPAGLARLGTLAAFHHERLDGSGYHRGISATALSLAARVLAAADVYQAMTEPRPHRLARSADEAAAELRKEISAGRLDGEAASAVLSAAGHRVKPARRETVAGLSAREVDVLRLLARGLSTKHIAARLYVADKTVDNHIQHIYAKIGVSTRAGATLFAMEQDLLTSTD